MSDVAYKLLTQYVMLYIHAISNVYIWSIFLTKVQILWQKMNMFIHFVMWLPRIMSNKLVIHCRDRPDYLNILINRFINRYVSEINKNDTVLTLWAFIDVYLHQRIFSLYKVMMRSSNGNIFRVTGHLCGEFTGPRWIPLTKASDAELWCFLWSASEWKVE